MSRLAFSVEPPVVTFVMLTAGRSLRNSVPATPTIQYMTPPGFEPPQAMLVLSCAAAPLDPTTEVKSAASADAMIVLFVGSSSRRSLT